MKIKTKFIIFSTIYSILILLILITIFGVISFQARRKEVFNTTEVNLEMLSEMIEHELHHYVTIVESISSSRTIEEAIRESNTEYDLIDSTTRNNLLTSLNQTWIDSDNDDIFITDILENDLSSLLKDILESEVDYYGEIFITNKYGLMIGSSGRLSTLTHGTKYWFEGAYNNNDPRVYFDDRGYDNSVESVVMGVVLPLYYDGEFAGIIKTNIIVTEMLDNHISLLNNLSSDGEYIITRDNGLILSKEDTEPLSEYIESDIIQYFDESGFMDIVPINDSKYYLGISEVDLDDFDEEFFFGGSEVTSEDHSSGSIGGFWNVIFIQTESSLNQTSIKTILITSLIGASFIVILVPISILMGNNIISRIQLVRNHTFKLAKGDYGNQIDVKSKDEISELTKDFNALSLTLKSTTTSIEDYQTALEKSVELEKQLLKTSRIDELTKIYNRRGFNEYFNKYFENSIRNGTQIGFIIFDIDDFKNVNDTCGHTKGDEVLQSISKTIKDSLRKGDIFCRWGGEEFVVLTPKSTKDEVWLLSEKIRKLCSEISIINIPKITISLGSTVSEKNDTTDAIITRADSALYDAKQNGKNRTELRLVKNEQE